MTASHSIYDLWNCIFIQCQRYTGLKTWHKWFLYVCLCYFVLVLSWGRVLFLGHIYYKNISGTVSGATGSRASGGVKGGVRASPMRASISQRNPDLASQLQQRHDSLGEGEAGEETKTKMIEVTLERPNLATNWSFGLGALFFSCFMCASDCIQSILNFLNVQLCLKV